VGPLNVDSRRRSNVSNAQIVAIPISLYLASDQATYYEGPVLVVDGAGPPLNSAREDQQHSVG
jgi:hypothetical protein